MTVPVQNFINRVDAQVAAGTITPAQGMILISDAIETAGPDGMLSVNERRGLSADLKVDKAYTAQFSTQTPSPPPPPPPPTPTPVFSFRPPKRINAISEPPPPTPVVPEPPPAPAITKGIKQATPDIIVFDEGSIDPGFLVQSFFEEFGGTELINISRFDLINGDSVSYSPIVNLSEIYRKYNPYNIIDISQNQEILQKYGISLLQRGAQEPYFDESGNLVIEIDIVKDIELIDVEIASSGTIDRIEQ